ncbi:MAG: TonB-dependent receptor plug domain-containing protein [Bacteroidetes bacterium]|nr:TonB-dependent receptor plug domain-containing protein [Bacteroidota bacterium]
MAVLCLAATFAQAQNKVTLSGYIKDAASQEALIGATIFQTNSQLGTTTNEYGFYTLTLPVADTFGLVISYIGYQAQAKKVATKTNLRLDILLEPDGLELAQVEVVASRNNDNVQRAQMGVVDVPMRAINTLPVLGGERDILKVIQLLPGVQGGQEGTTGFYVRGGNLDQNLVQLDEATVYNPNHLFGLFSTFNVNALNNVTLIKGGFPAEYGGRLSSILDITMKEGNREKYQVEGGLGLLSANLTVQGPLVKNKSSFIISARRSYADLLLKPFVPKSKNGTTYYLYDLNAKVNYDLGKNDKLFLSFFNGKDDARYTGANSLNYGINFGNATGTLRWNHLIGNRLFTNTSLVFNDYHLALSTTQGKYYALLFTAITDVTAKSDLTFIPNPKHQIKLGAAYTHHKLYPGGVSAKIPKKGNRLTIDRKSIQQQPSDEAAVYLSDEWKASDNFSISGGLRAPYFTRGTRNYIKIEPRLTAKLSIDPTTSMKASWTVMNQFLHLISNSTASLPTDIWLSSSNLVKPQRSEQYALGLFKNFNDNAIEASIEGYYKTMHHQVLFKEGAQILLNSNIEDLLTFGSGKSYGVEFFVKKNFGKLAGWASYTLSKTTQTFPELNFGKPFPFTYDRRHSVSVAGSYEFSKHWTFAADFVFNTGAAFTLPTGRVPVYEDGSLYNGIYYDLSGRNNARLRNYHRLDVSFIYKKQRHLFGKAYDSEWVFGAYNVYSRSNAYFVYLTTDRYTGVPSAKQLSLLSVIPSVSYNFKF